VVQGSTYSAAGNVPVVTETTQHEFVTHEYSNESAVADLQPKPQQSSGSKERRKRTERTPMQMIDNSLTVNIEQDMQQRANISPPKQVTRLGTQQGYNPSASKPASMPISKSASKLPAR